MKQSFRIPSIVLVLGLLIAAFGVGSVLAKQADFGSLGQLDSSHAPAAMVDLDQDEVSWADEDGQTVDYVKPGATSTFYILDDGLETTPDGTWDFSFTGGTVVANQTELDIAAETVGGVTDRFRADADGFTPANTPVVPGSLTVTDNFPVLRTPTSFVVVSPISGGATTTVEFKYHVVDEYLAENVLDGDGEVVTERDRRAKVVSTSDPQGEWVTISEVTGYGGSAVASPDSNIYRGDIRLSDNAGTQGTRSDGVWVQDDDTVTVRYVNADGNAIDTDTMTADGVKPSILNISPANGAVLDASNPTLRFDVVDEGSKMDLSNLVSNDAAVVKDITVEINGIQVSGGSFQGVPERITFIYATGNKWTDAYGVRDSDPFYIRITATDVAGNTATVEREADDDNVLTGGHKITLDSTKPTATGAETGIGWDRSKAEETSNDDTAVRVTFSEDIDPASVSASDFTVGGVRPSAAVVGTTEDDAGYCRCPKREDDEPGVPDGGGLGARRQSRGRRHRTGEGPGRQRPGYDPG